MFIIIPFKQTNVFNTCEGNHFYLFNKSSLKSDIHCLASLCMCVIWFLNNETAEFICGEYRYELFMEAFSHISGNIDKIYKQLTKSNTHPLGGTAYLNLENEDDPFLHGIKYTAMPPTKRFRDMEQLSGGEKTVAALALLFSIHRYVKEYKKHFFCMFWTNLTLDAGITCLEIFCLISKEGWEFLWRILRSCHPCPWVWVRVI